MLLQFQCVRKHLIFDKTYTLFFNGTIILIGETLKAPKYSIPINLNSIITFHYDTELFGFSIFYKGIQKQFVASPQKLIELKKYLDGKILYGEMNQFYKPLQVLGEGAFAQVQMVQNLQTKQVVAAKFLNKIREGKTPNERMQDIVNEITILGQLMHPNILKINEIYDKKNQVVIIHEFIEGMTLEKYIEEKGLIISQQDIQSIMRQILLALIYIHEHGLLHRDIKPDNIMIDKTLNIKLIDFGLATKEGSPFALKKCGTPGYMAPEIIQTQKQTSLSNKSDIFSLGVVFYKLVTQEDLFISDQFKSAFQKNIDFEFSLNKVYESTLSEYGIDLLKKMLEFNQKERISTKDALMHPYFKESLRPSARKLQLQSQTYTYFRSFESFNSPPVLTRKFSQQNKVNQFNSPQSTGQSTIVNKKFVFHPNHPKRLHTTTTKDMRQEFNF